MNNKDEFCKIYNKISFNMWPILWMCALGLVQFELCFGRFLFVPMEERTNATGTLKDDWCTDQGAYKTITEVTLYTCGEECMRRIRCKSVLYYTQMKFCWLRDVVTVIPTSTQGLRNLCISSDISTWDYSVIGNCGTKPCFEKERCYLNQYLIDRCEVTECPRPVISNGQVASLTSDVGSSTTFFCNEPFTKVGQSNVITCGSNGEWSPTPEVACYRRCDFPPTFDNADMTLVSPYVYVANETIDYECKTDYHRQDATDISGIICDEHGDWSVPRCIVN